MYSILTKTTVSPVYLPLCSGTQYIAKAETLNPLLLTSKSDYKHGNLFDATCQTQGFMDAKQSSYLLKYTPTPEITVLIFLPSRLFPLFIFSS